MFFAPCLLRRRSTSVVIFGPLFPQPHRARIYLQPSLSRVRILLCGCAITITFLLARCPVISVTAAGKWNTKLQDFIFVLPLFLFFCSSQISERVSPKKNSNEADGTRGQRRGRMMFFYLSLPSNRGDSIRADATVWRQRRKILILQVSGQLPSFPSRSAATIDLLSRGVITNLRTLELAIYWLTFFPDGIADMEVQAFEHRHDHLSRRKTCHILLHCSDQIK